MWYVNIKGIWFTIKTRRAAHDKRRDLRMAKGRSRDQNFRSLHPVPISGAPDPIIGVRIPEAAHSCKKDCKRGLARVFGGTLPAILMRRSCCRDFVLGYAKGEIDELLEYVRAFYPEDP